MRAKPFIFLRWTIISISLAMMAVSGHYWNQERVDHSILFMYDGMLLLLSLLILAMMMSDAGETQKNINAVVFLLMGLGSLILVFS